MKKKQAAMLLLLVLQVSMLFAQGLVPSQMKGLMDDIQEAFTGDIVRIVLICCFAGCGIAYAYNKDNEKMKRSLIAVGLGIIIVGAASILVEAVINAAK